MLIRFYTTAAGASPVEKYLDSLTDQEMGKVLAAIADLEANGLDDGPVRTRPIRGKLWELKVGAQRVFYVVVTGPTMVLLHAYKKQSRKAPPKEIEIAEKRMREVLAEAG